MLKWLGSIGMGLSLMEEMLTTRVMCNPNPEVQVRAFNVFFGLGIPAPLQTEGYEGVLEPLQPLKASQ